MWEFSIQRGGEKKVAVRGIRWSRRVRKVAEESRRGGGDMSNGERGMLARERSDNGRCISTWITREEDKLECTQKKKQSTRHP